MLNKVFLYIIVISSFILIGGIVGLIFSKDEVYEKVIINSSLLLIFSALGFAITENYTSKIEFPAEKYELKLKVTEQDGVKDSTYIIIPRNKQKNE